MGFFSALLGSKTTNKKANVPKKPVKQSGGLQIALREQPVFVQVIFLDFDQKAPPRGLFNEYTYAWYFKQEPELGDRVIIPGTGGDSQGMVLGISAFNDYPGELKSVKRIATYLEVKEYAAKKEKDFNAWLDMARREAGLPTKTQRKNPPKGYEPIPPATGDASTPQTAADHGRIWWKLYKSARTEEEEKAFKNIAHRWYAKSDNQ